MLSKNWGDKSSREHAKFYTVNSTKITKICFWVKGVFASYCQHTACVIVITIMSMSCVRFRLSGGCSAAYFPATWFLSLCHIDKKSMYISRLLRLLLTASSSTRLKSAQWTLVCLVVYTSSPNLVSGEGCWTWFSCLWWSVIEHIDKFQSFPKAAFCLSLQANEGGRGDIQVFSC